jgi:hypothetical protein
MQSLLFYKLVIPHDGCGGLAYTKLCVGWLSFVPSLSVFYIVFATFPFHAER